MAIAENRDTRLIRHLAAMLVRLEHSRFPRHFAVAVENIAPAFEQLFPGNDRMLAGDGAIRKLDILDRMRPADQKFAIFQLSQVIGVAELHIDDRIALEHFFARRDFGACRTVIVIRQAQHIAVPFLKHQLRRVLHLRQILRQNRPPLLVILAADHKSHRLQNPFPHFRLSARPLSP